MRLIDNLLKDYKKPEDIIMYLDAHPVQSARWRARQKQGDLPGDRFTVRGLKEVLGMWIAQTEGAKFLAAGGDGTEESRRDRHLYCLC